MKRFTTDHIENLDEQNEVCLILTHEEVEMLYEGLDAACDRFEAWSRMAAQSKDADTDVPRLEEEYDRYHELSKEFSPLIGEIRETKKVQKHMERVRNYLMDQVTNYVEAALESEDDEALLELDLKARLRNFCTSTLEIITELKD